MDKNFKKLQINTNTTNDSNQLSPEKKSFINKLYLDPIESLNKKLAETKSRGFRIKTDVSKTNTEYSTAGPTTPAMRTGMTNITNPLILNMNRTQGNIIMQNWATSKNIPSDIGEFIHFPVLVDRKKLKLGMEQGKSLSYTTSRNFKFNKSKIHKEGEKLVKSLYVKDKFDNMALTMPTNFPSSQQNIQDNYISFQTTEDNKHKEIIDNNLMTFQKKPKFKRLTESQRQQYPPGRRRVSAALRKTDANSLSTGMLFPEMSK